MTGPAFAFGRPPGEVIQYAYTVPDVSAAIEVYVSRLGVGPWFRRGPFTPPAARYRGKPCPMTITLARAFAGDSMIELIQQHDDSPSVFTERGHGFHHWAIGTHDVDAEIRRFAPITSTALSVMPRDQAGVAGAIASTCRQTGSAIGVAVTGAILAGSSAGLVHASRPAWAVLAGCGIATLALGLASAGRWAQASARRNGERLAAETVAFPTEHRYRRDPQRPD